MRLRSAVLATLFLALCLLSLGCGDEDNDSGGTDGDNTYAEDTNTATSSSGEADPGCEEVADYPIRITVDPPGYMVMCSTADGLSVHVENVSAHVLRFWPKNNSTLITLEGGTTESPGLEVTRGVVPGGWYNDGKFVLSVGQSLTASDTQPVFLWFETDLNLTATVTAYRYVGDWVASRLQTRGQALFNRVQTVRQA